MSTTSVPKLDPCISLPLDEKTLEDVVEKAKDWALMHGASMRSRQQFSKDSIQFAPFILTPSTFPRKEFDKAVSLQIILNELMHKVAHDAEFLTSALKDTITVDDFTGQLFNIFQTIQKEGVAQPISLGLMRSDLMLESVCPKKGEQCAIHKPYCCWKQVEINTIASGFGHLGPISAELQRYVLQELGYGEKLKNLPENLALTGLCSAMLEAWTLAGIPDASILFIVENVTFNISDQRFHEFELRRLNPNVPVIRRTLTELSLEAKLGPSKELIVGNIPVTVVYFRAGYEPAQYPTENEWKARLLIERSKAIKCPSIHYHLAGTKKVQQALAKPGVLNRFLTDSKKVEQVSEIFTGLYSLDHDEYGNHALNMAIETPERFVLKPQREGGGNNVYGTDIRNVLREMGTSKERCAWILMERIQPPLSVGYMVRPGGPALPPLVNLVSELGIFGAIIGDSKTIIYNKQVGHMLRTKLSTADEGGVAAGLGALDSPYLID